MLSGAFLDSSLKFGREIMQLLEPRPGFILPPSSAQRGLGKAYERRGMKRPLQEGDVSQHSQVATGRRIALQSTTALGEQHKGKVRPFGLVINPPRQGMEIRIVQRLFGCHRETRACGHFLDKLIKTAANYAGSGDSIQHRRGHSRADGAYG